MIKYYRCISCQQAIRRAYFIDTLSGWVHADGFEQCPPSFASAPLSLDGKEMSEADVSYSLNLLRGAS